jgi:plastocyanin
MRAERPCGYGGIVRLSAAALFVIFFYSAALSKRAEAARELPGWADEGRNPGGGVKPIVSDAATPLKMTCTVHGVANMTLQFEREVGAARVVEITGTTSGARWTVKVDGTDVTPATQTSASPGQVKLHAGDKVTWTVTGSNHGIAFPTQAAAEAMFTFDASMGKPLGASTAKPGFTWGTGSFGATTTLAVAAVKETESSRPELAAAPLKLTCTVHGVANMTLQFEREAGAARVVEITGTTSGARWTVKVDGTDVTPATQTSASPGQVKLHADDKVTWTVTGSNHGIAFPTQAAAEAMFMFDASMGKPLGASTAKPGFTWGTGSFGPTTTLAVATVKPAP